MKPIQQLRTESTQLSAREACIKTFMETYEEPMPPSSSSDEADSVLLHFLVIKGENKS